MWYVVTYMGDDSTLFLAGLVYNLVCNISHRVVKISFSTQEKSGKIGLSVGAKVMHFDHTGSRVSTKGIIQAYNLPRLTWGNTD